MGVEGGDGGSIDSATVRIRLPRKSGGIRTAAYTLIGVAAAGAVVNVGMSVWNATSRYSSPVLVWGHWLPWLPIAALALFVSIIVFRRDTLDFTSDALTQSTFMPLSVMRWRDVTCLMLPRKYRQFRVGPFPAIVVIEGASPRGLANSEGEQRFIGYQPGRLDSPACERLALEELLRHCPPQVVDPEIALAYGLAFRVERCSDELLQSAASLSPDDPAIAAALAEPGGRETLTAGYEYLFGRVDKARAQCMVGLLRESGAWDLLLCRALCERAVGDDAAWRRWLQSALEASPPEFVAPVLRRQLEVS